MWLNDIIYVTVDMRNPGPWGDRHFVLLETGYGYVSKEFVIPFRGMRNIMRKVEKLRMVTEKFKTYPSRVFLFKLGGPDTHKECRISMMELGGVKQVCALFSWEGGRETFVLPEDAWNTFLDQSAVIFNSLGYTGQVHNPLRLSFIAQMAFTNHCNTHLGVTPIAANPRAMLRFTTALKALSPNWFSKM